MVISEREKKLGDRTKENGLGRIIEHRAAIIHCWTDQSSQVKKIYATQGIFFVDRKCGECDVVKDQFITLSKKRLCSGAQNDHFMLLSRRI